MIPDPYNEAVRRLFAEPRHTGTLTGGVTALVRDQGVSVELSATVDLDRLSAVRFRAWGCPHLIAAAEWTARHYEGGPPLALEVFPIAQIMVDLAVPVEKTGRILVLEDAVQSLGRSLNHQ